LSEFPKRIFSELVDVRWPTDVSD